MSNPYDPSQPDHQQQWGQPPYPQQPGQGYDAGWPQGGPPPPPYNQGQQGSAQGGQQPWGGAQQWQQPAQPAQPTPIDWNTAPPRPEQAPWRGPAPFAPPAPPAPPAAPEQHEEPPQRFAPPAGHDQPWVSGGSAQTAQEVADHWQSTQEAQSAAPQPLHSPPAPVAEHYQPPAAEPQAPLQPPAPAQQPRQQPQQAPGQQAPSYDAPAHHDAPAAHGAPSDHPINEAATATTPAVADQAEEPEALTIGRGRDNSIVLDDMLVSRQHVRITADADGLILEDLGSRNGTYVNGRRVERTHLSEGDRIGIGAATFEVRDGWLLNV